MGCLKDLFEAGSQLPAGEYLTTLPLRGVYKQTLFGKKPLLTINHLQAWDRKKVKNGALEF